MTSTSAGVGISFQSEIALENSTRMNLNQVDICKQLYSCVKPFYCYNLGLLCDISSNK